MDTQPRAPGPRDPEELDAATTERAHLAIAAATKVGAVQLTVSDLERSLAYYRTTVGLDVLEASAGQARLGAGGLELLVLVEEPGARSGRGYTGLYHFALVVPSRPALARWLEHAGHDDVSLVGLSDHFVSEAIYLSDPDGHGIELYWDRPRELWEGRVGTTLTTLPLDVASLLAELDGSDAERFSGLPRGTVMGHVHMKVADIETTVAFYRDGLGFGLMAQLGQQAAFLSAGGYHHHIGANTWESAGAEPPPPGTAAMRHATIVLPGAAARDEVLTRVDSAGIRVQEKDGEPAVVDPSGNVVLLAVG